MTELLVSYCRDDSTMMEPIVENLRKLGFDLWVDVEHLTPGTPAWTKAIDEALRRADGVLAFLSPAAKDSHWCNIETQRAQILEKPIYPILVSGDEKTAVPIHLTGYQYADMRGRAEREKNFEQLVKTLSKELDHPVPEYELQAGQGGVPVVNNVIHISGHVEGNVYALNVAGDVAGDVNVAGGDIHHHRAESIDRLPERLRRGLTHSDPDTRYFAIERAEKMLGDPQHGADIRALLEDMQYDDPDRDVRRRAAEAVRGGETVQPVAEVSVPEPKPKPEVETPEPEPETPIKLAVSDVIPHLFAWCEIPTGLVTIEDEDDNEIDFVVESFHIAKFPITHEQFRVFIDDPRGFSNPEWWKGLAASEDHWKAPGKQFFTHGHYLPRENVSWYDAVAFCRWLSRQTGYEIRLPTEWEWQLAAQGEDYRAYPWGDRYLKGYANINETSNVFGSGDYLEETMPVNNYPQGASPYGVLDMCGNVWEWCLNEYDDLRRTDTSGAAWRVVRGGSWSDNRDDARVTYRYWYVPDTRSYDIGFRIATSVPRRELP